MEGVEKGQLWVPTPDKPGDSKRTPRDWIALEPGASEVDAPRTVWELAEVRSWGAAGTSAVVAVAGRELTVELSDCHYHDPSHLVDFEDAGQMGDLHEAPLIKLLSRRHARDAIYTWTGETLLSINPYRLIPGLYDAERLQGTILRSETEEDTLPPHIFSVADLAYRQLLVNTKQVLVVNGESGAGKTEACRQLLRYIACASSAARLRAEVISPPAEAPSAADKRRVRNAHLWGSACSNCFGPFPRSQKSSPRSPPNLRAHHHALEVPVCPINLPRNG
jgi:hypothetical protein